MKVQTTERGFRLVTMPRYKDPQDEIRLIQESSAIGDYEDSLDNPGSSYLWVGDDLHLDRDQIASLASLMNSWLLNKRLPLGKKK